MIPRSLFVMSALALFAPTIANAQYQTSQYNPPSFFSPGGGGAPIVVPPTVIMAGEQGSSKKSCRENVIDLFLISWRTRTGDCSQ
jgi:hypothetical protein